MVAGERGELIIAGYSIAELTLNAHIRRDGIAALE
jgi:hypothetical protein